MKQQIMDAVRRVVGTGEVFVIIAGHNHAKHGSSVEVVDAKATHAEADKAARALIERHPKIYNMKVKYLPNGWKDPDFDTCVDDCGIVVVKRMTIDQFLNSIFTPQYD